MGADRGCRMRGLGPLVVGVGGGLHGWEICLVVVRVAGFGCSFVGVFACRVCGCGCGYVDGIADSWRLRRRKERTPRTPPPPLTRWPPRPL